MLGAILVILSLIAGAAYVAKIGTGFTLLFIGAVVFMAYKRLPLIAFTVVFTLLLAGYTYIAPPAGIWKGFLWVLLAALWLFNLRPLRKAIISRPFLKAYMRLLPSMSQTEKEALEAGTVWWDGELLHGQAQVREVVSRQAAGAHRRGAGVHRRPLRRTVPHVRRLGRHAQARRHAAEGVGLPQAQGFLRDDHPEEIRRPRVLRVRALLRAGETRQPLGPAGRDHRRAELPRPRRTAQPLRHRGTEEPLPAAPGARRGSALLRADSSARRFRRGVAARHRHRLQGHVPGQGDRRAQAQLLQALHHARAHRDGRRPRVPPLRPGQVVRWRQGRLRHHLRADSAQHRRASPSAGAISRSTFRSRTGRCRARTCSFRSIPSSAGRRWPARAGACWSSSCRSVAASRCRRTPPAAPRAACSPRARTRASAASSTCRWASSRASKPSSRAWWATPTPWTRRVRSPRAPSMVARSRRCLRPC